MPCEATSSLEKGDERERYAVTSISKQPMKFTAFYSVADALEDVKSWKGVTLVV
jgi:hypothetical protein